MLIGRVTSVFGIKGWVNVFSYTDPPENILRYKSWLLSPFAGDGQSKRFDYPAPSECQKVTLSEGQRHGKKIIAQLNQAGSRDEAARYIQQDVFIYREELPELEDDIYWIDLMGLEVFNQQGQMLGRIKRMMATGANDVMVVQDASDAESAREVLIPFVDEHYVLDVDLEHGKIIVDWELD